MNRADQTLSTQSQEPTASRRSKYNPLDLRFAALVVAVISLIIALTYYHKHTFVVESVLDGDTLIVNKWGWKCEVQLAGADAPEIHKDEPFAETARIYLQERILGRKVWLEFLDPGRKLDYKSRMLCWVWLDGENISYMLVGQGYARFSGAAEADARTILAMLQTDAKENSRGLWSARKASYQPLTNDESNSPRHNGRLHPNNK